MAQKKINGYTILMKEILGKGSYGSVEHSSFRYTEVNKTAPKKYVQSKFFKKC